MANKPIYQRVALTEAGAIIPGAEYTVTNENTGTALTIYSSRTGAAKSAPYFADDKGKIQFWTEPGVIYRVTASGGVGTYVDRYVEAIQSTESSIDQTIGRMLKVGAGKEQLDPDLISFTDDVGPDPSQVPQNSDISAKFGFAGDAISIPSDNAENCITGGAIYKVTSTTANLPTWAGLGSTIFATTFDSAASTEDVQLRLISANGHRTATNAIVNGILGSWAESITDQNAATHDGVIKSLTALGNVIESGENANGLYVILASGIKICTYSSAQITAAYSTWNYPIVFNSTPRVFGAATQPSTPSDRFVVLDIPALISCGFARVFGSGASATSSSEDACQLFAIGV